LTVPDNELVVIDRGKTTLNENVFEADACVGVALSVTVTVTEKLPGDVAVPVIRPVPELMENVGGRPEAVHT
jgi:hypothetical protein